jgi:hypothetical protein
VFSDPRQPNRRSPTWRLAAGVYGLLFVLSGALAAARALTQHWRLTGLFADVADFSSHWQLGFLYDHSLAFYGSLSTLGVVLLASSSLLAVMRWALPVVRSSPLRAGRTLWAYAALGFAAQSLDDQNSLHEYLGSRFVGLTGARVPGINRIEDLWFPVLGLIATALAVLYRETLRMHAKYLWLLWMGLVLFGLSSSVDAFGPPTEVSQALEEGAKLFAVASFFIFQLSVYLDAVARAAAGAGGERAGGPSHRTTSGVPVRRDQTP